MKCRLLSLLVALAPAIAVAAPPKRVTDFSEDMPDAARPDSLALRFRKVRPLPGGSAGDVVVILHKKGDDWNAVAAAADYNQKTTNAAELADGLSWTDGKRSGTLKVTIGAGGVNPGQKPLSKKADRFTLSFSAELDKGKLLPFIPDREAFMPPWRKDTPVYGGILVEGSYRGTFHEEKVEGKVVGSANNRPRPGAWGTTGNAVIRPADGGGMKVLVRLSPERVMGPSAGWAIGRFAERQDWSGYDGLRITVDSAKRRNDAAVAVGVHEGTGAWRSLTSAALLLGKEASFDVPFADMHARDLDAVQGMQIGVRSTHGVGDVEFVVRKVELYHDPEPAALAPPPKLLKVDPQTVLSFNGTTEAPKGLFGFHDVNGGKKPEDADAAAAELELMETIKPGFFRPLTHVGFGAKAITDEEIRERVAKRVARKSAPDSWFLKRAMAADALDNIVWCHTVNLWARPPWMDKPMDKFLAGVEAFYRAQGARAWVPGDKFNPLRRLEVWNEPFMWGRHINMGFQQPAGRKRWTDPTQYGFLPTRLGAEVYAKIFLAAAKGARSANEHVKLGGPCSASFGDDDYGHFRHFVAPILREVADEIDFITEHHYFGNPKAYAASYDVVKGWCDVELDRRIPIYNTECNHLGNSSAAKARYNIVDILSCISVCPDVAKGRAMHALWSGTLRDPGEVAAYMLLRPLRGALIPVETGAEGLSVAASAPDPATVEVVLFADRPVELRLPLPEGWAVTEMTRLRLGRGARGGPTEGYDPVDFGAKGKGEAGEVRMEKVKAKRLMRFRGKPMVWEVPGRTAERLTIRWVGNGRPAPRDARLVEQSFCKATFADVEPGAEVGGKILWRGKGPDGAKTATLRLVTRDVHRGEGVVSVNGTGFDLPYSSSNDGQALAREIEIPVDLLKEETTLTFRCRADRSNGFTVYAASVLVQR